MRSIHFIVLVLITVACSQDKVAEVIGHSHEDIAYVTAMPATENKNIINKCAYDNDTESLGLGLVAVPPAFELFSDSLLTNTYLMWNMYSSDAPPKPVCSKYYKPDYGIMQFVCLEKAEKYYKVLAGYDQVFFLPVAEDYEFVTWQDYILTSFGVRRNTDLDSEWKDQPLRKLPNASSEELDIPEGLEMFCAMEMKGEWLKVKYDCFYNTETELEEGAPCHEYIDKCANTVTGWLKWRDNNKVLIDVMTML